MMTPRERLMTVLRGGRADRVPCTIYKWLLPPTGAARRLQDEGLTPIDACQLHKEHHRDVTIERRDIVERGARQTLTRVITPAGELSEVTAYDSSYGSPWIKKHLVQTEADFAPMLFVLRNSAQDPDYDDILRRQREIGDSGIVLGFIQPVPVARLWVELMGPETWCEWLMERGDLFDELHAAAFVSYRRQIDIAAASPAEIVWLPDNITATMVSPDTFQRYCAPVYDYACSTLGQAGKLTFAHYDGMNRALSACIADTGIDIIEAFTPPPMGDMTVAEARAAWPGKVLCLNFPGCLFREDPRVIEAHTRAYMEQAGDGAGFTIGCTEDFDAAHFEKVFGAIVRAVG